MGVILADLTGLRRLGRPNPSYQRRGDRGWRAQDPVGGGWVFPRDQCHPLSFLSQRWCGLQRRCGVSIKARAAWPRPAGLLCTGWSPGVGPVRRGGWRAGRPNGCICQLRSAPGHCWGWRDRAAAGGGPCERRPGGTSLGGKQPNAAPFDQRSRWRAGSPRS
jgi:hypothetical protein